MSGSSSEPSPRFGEVRSRWVFLFLIGVSIVVAASVLYLTRYMNFYYDEWDFVTAYRPGQPTSILFPHNEHWSTVPILIWKLLLSVFGLRSHLPYEAAAIASHVACVLLLFALVRRRSGDLPALGAALILLVFGNGSTNIIWAFQLGWTLSIAFGLLAMLLLEVSPQSLSLWRGGAISVALLGSVMSSGIGLGFLVAGAVQLLTDRARRGQLVVLIFPLAVYFAWFLAYGGVLNGTPNPPCTTCGATVAGDLRSIGPAYLLNVLVFAALGIRATIASLVAIAGNVGPFAAFLVVLSLAWYRSFQGRLESWELGLLAGVTVQFLLIGLARARLGPQYASDSHYVYVGAVYFLPLLANAVKRLPWRGLWRPALSGAFALAIVSNAILLVDRAVGNTELMRTENAELRTVEYFQGAPDMAVDRPLDPAIMPQLTAAKYLAAVDQLGSPVPSSMPHSLSSLPTDAVDREMNVLFGDAVKVSPAGQESVSGLTCHQVDSSAGGAIDAKVADGSWIVMSATVAGSGLLSIGFVDQPSPWRLQQLQIPAAAASRIQLPNTGRHLVWSLRITTGPVGDLQVCGPADVSIQPMPG